MNAATRASRIPFLHWPKASLRTYLVAMMLLATVPVAALMSYQVLQQIRMQDTRLQEGIRSSASVLAQSVNRELSSSIDALTILSYAGEIQNQDLALFEQALLTRPLSRQSWSGIYLRRLDGAVVFDTYRMSDGMDSSARDLLPALPPVNPQQAAVSNLQSNRSNRIHLTTVEVPVIIKGVASYVLGARIPSSVWQQLVNDAGLASLDLRVMLDRDYHVIARNRLQERFVGTPIMAPNQSVLSERSSGTARLNSPEGGFSDAAWDTAPLSGWVVVVGMRAGPIDEAHDQAILAALGTAGLCLVLGVLLALLVARQMTRPLRQLARNDLSPPGERIVVHEIARLRDALVAAKVHDETTRELIRKKRDLLRKKADEFEAMLASCPIGLAFAQDRACRNVTHNDAMKELFGRSGSEGMRAATVLHQGEVLQRDQQPLQRAAALGESIFGMELEVRVQGRRPAFVIVNAVPLRDENGEPRGAIGAMVDITGRKAAEERLISAEQRLRESQRLVDLAQQTGHVGFFHYQIDEGKLAWTPGQAKLFGLSTSDGIHALNKWTRHIEQRDWRRTVRTLYRAFKAKLEMENLDYCVLMPDGSQRWLSSRVRLIYGLDGQPRHIIGVSVDVTEQKIAEQERDMLIIGEQAARIEAETANRAKDEFLAMLGHELRNPLSAIASGIEVLNRVDGQTDVAKNARRIIDRQTRHLAHMMDDLLDVARVLSGQSLPRHALDVSSLVQRVIATLQIAGELKDHELVMEIEEVWINANPTRIEQVMSNLLINAIKYTPPGGRIEVRVLTEGTRALLEVKDNGVGIAKDLLPRVFDLFVQGERTLDRRGGGLGIGLTLVRRLVELHEGSISVANAEPGTIMRISLPAIEKPELIPLPRQESAQRNRHIAIIEDNEDVLEGLSTMLRMEGHTVWTTNDGVRGLKMLLDQRPEVAIVDVGLPGLTGYELATHARAGGFTGKLFALSGYGQERDRQQALAAGFDMHFLKPVQINELLEFINSD